MTTGLASGKEPFGRVQLSPDARSDGAKEARVGVLPVARVPCPVGRRRRRLVRRRLIG